MWHETARQRDRETERQRDRETERHSEVGYHGIVFVREKAFVRQVAMSHCLIVSKKNSETTHYLPHVSRSSER